MASSSNCPWGAPKESAPTTSLKDVMSEQLASDLQAQEEGQSHGRDKSSANIADLTEEEIAKILGEDTSDDHLIAQMLQMQFDREHDQALGQEETHRNGTSKVTVSYEKYRIVPDNPVWEDSDDEDEELAAYLDMDEKKRHWDW